MEREWIQIRYKEGIIYSECGEVPEQAVKRSRGCPIPGRDQDQVGWGFQRPGLLRGYPAHGRELDDLELDDSERSEPFYDFMKRQVFVLGINPLHNSWAKETLQTASLMSEYRIFG